MEENSLPCTIDQMQTSSHENKLGWISQIYMKRIMGEPLSKEDHRFMVLMSLSRGNEEYARLIAADIEVVQSKIDELGDKLDPESYLKLLQGQIHLKSNLYRVQKQGQRDDAVAEKVNLDTINRYMKMAKQDGFEFKPSMLGGNDPVVIDLKNSRKPVVTTNKTNEVDGELCEPAPSEDAVSKPKGD